MGNLPAAVSLAFEMSIVRDRQADRAAGTWVRKHGHDRGVREKERPAGGVSRAWAAKGIRRFRSEREEQSGC